MRVSYARDGSVGCLMRSILTDDFGNLAAIVEREWIEIDGVVFEDARWNELCVSRGTMDHIYRELPTN